MDIPIKIESKYVRMGDIVVQRLYISILQDVTLKVGSIVVLNPKAPESMIIVKEVQKEPVKPYADK